MNSILIFVFSIDFKCHTYRIHPVPEANLNEIESNTIKFSDPKIMDYTIMSVIF